MVVVEDRTRLTWEPRDQALNIQPPKRTRGWYLMPGRVGTFTLRFEGENRDISMLACLLLWLEQYGSIGSRPQLGYGAFRIINRDELVEKSRKWKGAVSQNGIQKVKSNQTSDHPDLRHFLFFRYEFAPSKPGWWTKVPGVGRVGSRVQPLVSSWGMVPSTPALKNEWRFHRWQGNRRDKLNIFGTLRPERKRGRISATWAYRENGKWVIHGWAWMPPENELAEQVQHILGNKSIWEKVFGVGGSLKTVPTGKWEDISSGEVQKLLQGICHD